MQMIADILLVAGALGAGIYCFVLGRRLNRFNDLEKGVGGAVAVLSAQVEDLRLTLASAQATAQASANSLTDLTRKAESMSRKLDLQMASLHDLPDTAPPEPGPVPGPGPSTSPKPDGTSEPMFVRRKKPELQQ